MARYPCCGEEIAGIPKSYPSCSREWSAPEPAIPQFMVQPGQYLRESWELFKQNPGGFIGFAVIFFITQGILSYLPRIGSLISLVITTSLGAGFFVVSAKLMQHRPLKCEDLFTGFQFFVPLILLSVVSTLLTILGFILFIVPGVFLMVCYLFISMLILNRRLDF